MTELIRITANLSEADIENLKQLQSFASHPTAATTLSWLIGIGMDLIQNVPAPDYASVTVESDLTFSYDEKGVLFTHLLVYPPKIKRVRRKKVQKKPGR